MLLLRRWHGSVSTENNRKSHDHAHPVRFRHAAPAQVGEHRLISQCFKKNLTDRRRSDKQHNRVPLFLPELSQQDGKQGVEYTGQAAVTEQVGLITVQPATDPQTAQSGQPCTAQPADPLLKQAAEAADTRLTSFV
jgi:hypothetical protein